MSTVRKNGNKGKEELRSPEDQKAKIDALRAAIGPLSGHSEQFCTDSCLSRYLRARGWSLKKAEKMLRETLKWRASFKPEFIRWEDVAHESETGKIYRSRYHDKLGRAVLVMRPGNQNTTGQDGQVKHLVYCLENAILNLAEGHEEMVWLIDFKNWSMKTSVPVKTTREIAYILQSHYPERLALALLYNPPRIFETFYAIVKPFLDPKTARKVKFVYSNTPESLKLLEDIADADKLEVAFGGTSDEVYNHAEYGRIMEQDDVKTALHWKLESRGTGELPLPGLADSAGRGSGAPEVPA